MTYTNRKLRGLSALAAAALVVAACGGDDSSSSSTSTTTEPAPAAETTTEPAPAAESTAPAPSGDPSTATNGNAKAAALVADVALDGPVGSGLTRGVTDTTIKIGCYLQQGQFAGADDGYNARFDRANESGEIPGGRTIEFLPCIDDGGTAQGNLQVVQKLVQQDEVFAVVGASGVILPASTDFLTQNEVPFTGWGYLPGFCHSRWSFGFNGCSITSDEDNPKVYGAGLVEGPIEAAGLKGRNGEARFAVPSGDDDAGKIGVSLFTDAIEFAGGQLVYAESNIPTPGPPTDFTPYVTAILDSDPNIVITLANFQTAPGLTAALTAAGYEGANVNYVAYVPGLLEASPEFAQAMNGALVAAQVPPQESQTPYIKQMEKDLVASGASSGDFISLASGLAYAEADLIVSMLKAVGPDLNTKTFDEVINGGGYVYQSSVEGGAGQMSFPAMHHIPSDCIAMLRIDGTSYTEVIPFTCYESYVIPQ